MIMSICNQKGGVAKTTTCVNLAAALAKLGKKVLAVDLDPQRNLSSTLSAETGTPGINELLYSAVANMGISTYTCIQHNAAEGIDFIPSTPMLSSAPSILSNDARSQSVLSRVLRAPELSEYDYILLDCRPSLDLLTINALVASDRVLVPVEAAPYALDGLLDLLGTVRSIQERENTGLQIAGLLLTKVDVRTTMSTEAEAMLREHFGSLVYDVVVPYLAEAPKAAGEHRSMVNAKKSRLGSIYMSLAEVILNAG